MATPNLSILYHVPAEIPNYPNSARGEKPPGFKMGIRGSYLGDKLNPGRGDNITVMKEDETEIPYVVIQDLMGMMKRPF